MSADKKAPRVIVAKGVRILIDGREPERYTPDPADRSLYDGLNVSDALAGVLVRKGTFEVAWDVLQDSIYDCLLESSLERLNA